MSFPISEWCKTSSIIYTGWANVGTLSSVWLGLDPPFSQTTSISCLFDPCFEFWVQYVSPCECCWSHVIYLPAVVPTKTNNKTKFESREVNGWKLMLFMLDDDQSKRLEPWKEFSLKSRGRIRKLILCRTTNAELTVEQPWAPAPVGCCWCSRNRQTPDVYYIVHEKDRTELLFFFSMLQLKIEHCRQSCPSSIKFGSGSQMVGNQKICMSVSLWIKSNLDQPLSISKQTFTIIRGPFVTHVDSEMW